MTSRKLHYVAAAALAAIGIITPAEAAKHFNLSVNDNNAEKCADLRASSSDGEVSVVEESFSFQKSEAPVLELNAAERGVIRVKAWDRAEFSVEVCKCAAAENMAAADQVARAITAGC